MAIDIVYAYGSNVTVTNTETSLATTGGTTTGVPQSITDDGEYVLMLDGVGALAKGDEYTLRIYEKTETGGTQRVIATIPIVGAQSNPIYIMSLRLGVAWDITLQRISANSRAFYWTIRRVS